MNNKDLPKVFAVPIDKKIDNNKDLFLSSNRSINNSEEKISPNEINKIFNSKTHVYKTRIEITTQNGKKEIDAIGLKGNNLLTLNGESIPINEIIEIKKV